MKLFYGSYDELLYEYYDCYDYYEGSDSDRKEKAKIFHRDFTALLLASSLGSVDDVADIWENIYDETVLARTRSGDLGVPEKIKALFTATTEKSHDEIADYVCKFLKARIIPYIQSRRMDCIADFCDLISEDDSISEHQKNAFIESASKDDNQFSKWLTEIFLYAVLQSPPKAYVIGNLPNRKNRYYVERGTAFQKINKHFRNNDTVLCISGMAGCGKTQLALAYAYQYSKNYKYICWIDAGSMDDIICSMRDFLGIVKAPISLEDDNDSIARDFCSWFNAHSKWLLIYDNAQYGSAEAPYDMKKYLPSSNKGNILFTTNNAYPYVDGEVLRLGVFSEKVALEFIKKRLNKRKVPTDADALARRLGYLPKAINEACAFLSMTPGTTIREYIYLLDVRRPGFADKLIQLDPETKSMCQTTIINFERLASEDAKRLLGMLSYFSDAGFDVQMLSLVKSQSTAEESMPESFLDSIEFYEIMKELRIYSLCDQILAKDDNERTLAYFGNTRKLKCHNLTQEIVRDYFDQDGAAAVLGLNFCYSAIKYCSAMTGDYYPLVPDILAFLVKAENALKEHVDKDLARKAANLYRFASWAIYDGDSRQKWLWDNHVYFTKKAYGYESAETAFSYLEYFEFFANTDFKDSFRKLNNALLIISEFSKQDCAFDHEEYKKRDGYPSLRLKAEGDNILEGLTLLKLISTVILSAELVAENKDIASAQKYCERQREWLLNQITELANDWNSQGSDEDDGTEDISPEKIMAEIDAAIGSLVTQ